MTRPRRCQLLCYYQYLHLHFCCRHPLLLLLAALVATLAAETKVSKLHIKEDGTDYNEDIEFDSQTKAITLKVPAYNHVGEQKVIIHKDSVSIFN